MVAWVKVAWINPLFAALDAIAPHRDHASDGTIGDTAHATGVSGHNPDDTVLPQGGRAERTDADTIPEVRAADADSDLKQPGIDMGTVVAAVLNYPPDRDRLIYVIYRRRIWRKDGGWKTEVYTGDDPHDEHAHFSGDPASDNDGRPWLSILALGVDMAALEPTDPSYIDLIYRVAALIANSNVAGGPHKGEANLLAAELKAIRTELTAQRAILQAIVDNGGTPDTALIMRRLDEVVAETRDAVADLGEGGAAQVRADAAGPGSE